MQSALKVVNTDFVDKARNVVHINEADVKYFHICFEYA